MREGHTPPEGASKSQFGRQLLQGLFIAQMGAWWCSLIVGE